MGRRHYQSREVDIMANVLSKSRSGSCRDIRCTPCRRKGRRINEYIGVVSGWCIHLCFPFYIVRYGFIKDGRKDFGLSNASKEVCDQGLIQGTPKEVWTNTRMRIKFLRIERIELRQASLACGEH